MSDKREGWLRELVAGSLVAIPRRGLGTDHHDIVKVVRITPGGKIVCQIGQSEETFDQRGTGPALGKWTPRNRLSQITPDLRKQIARERLVSTAMAVIHHHFKEKVQALSDEHLAALIEAILPLRSKE